MRTENKTAIKNKDELEFAVFCVENISNHLGKPAEKVYEALAVESNIMGDYIIPCYEILHTQDKKYIVNDILEVMKERGVKV